MPSLCAVHLHIRHTLIPESLDKDLDFSIPFLILAGNHRKLLDSHFIWWRKLLNNDDDTYCLKSTYAIVK